MRAFDREHLLLAAILVLGAVVRLTSLDGGWYLQDQVRDAMVAHGIVGGREFPLVGPHSALSTVRLVGPLYYYLLALPYAVSADPTVAVAFQNVLGLVSIYLTYRLGREMLGPAAGFVGAALYAVFPMAVLSGKALWNPGFTPFFSTLFLLSFWRFVTGRRPWLLALVVFLLGVLLQIHMSGAIFVVLILLAVLMYRPPIRPQPLAVGLLAVGLLYVPYAVFEIREGFPDLARMFTWVGAHREAPFWLIAGRGLWTPFLHPERVPGVLGEGALAWAFPLIQRAELVLLVLGLLVVLRRTIAGPDRRPWALLGVWFLLPFLVVPLNRTVIWYYFDILYPAQFLVIGGLVQAMLKAAARTGAPGRFHDARRIGTVALVAVIVVVQVWFGLRWDAQVRRAGLLRAPSWGVVLSDSEPSRGESVIETMPLRDKKALSRSFASEFGIGHRLAESRAHGAMYQLFREDKGLLFATLGTRARGEPADAAVHYLVAPPDVPATVEGERVVRVGPYRIIAYRPRIDYGSWRWSVDRGTDWWSAGVDDSSWTRTDLPARRWPDPTVFAQIPSARWPASRIVFRGTIAGDTTASPLRLVLNIRDAPASRHELGRFYLNGRPIPPRGAVSHSSSNFRNIEVPVDLGGELRPGPNLIAFEVVGRDGEFDLDVYELRTAVPAAFGR